MSDQRILQNLKKLKLLLSRQKVEQFIKCEGGDNAEVDVEKFQSFNVSRGAGAGKKKSRGGKVRREEDKSLNETDNSVSGHSVGDSEADGTTDISDQEYNEYLK